MNHLLIEGAQRQLTHLEDARRNAPLNGPVVACAKCYTLFDARYDQSDRLVIDYEPHNLTGHEPLVWPIEQVITKLKAYIDVLKDG